MNVLIYFLIFAAIVVLLYIGGLFCESLDGATERFCRFAGAFAERVCMVLMMPAALAYGIVTGEIRLGSKNY